jgi:hypothetical protein
MMTTADAAIPTALDQQEPLSVRRRLEIAVSDARVVRGGERFGDLTGDLAGKWARVVTGFCTLR